MNNLKYILMNGSDNVLGFIYNDNEKGRTIILNNTLNLNFPLQIYDKDGIKIEDIDLIEFIKDMLPTF